MSKFPIAQLIKSGESIKSMSPDGLPFENDMINQDVMRAQLISKAVFFDVSIACDLYWQGRKDYYVLGEDFGPMRPPYPLMWMEWTIPHSVIIDGKRIDREASTSHGALLHSWTQNTADMTIDTWRNYSGIDSTETVGEWGRRIEELRAEAIDMVTVQVIYYAQDEFTGEVVSIPYGKQMSMDTQGNYLPQTSVNLTPIRREYTPESLRMLRETCDLNVVWMALNLINCRNVSTRQVGSALPRSTREKRQGVPVKRYHTIVLPGMSYRYAGGRGRGQEQAQLAAHRVQGHFKTFGPDKPLLGKHVGTFWWGWQLRGNPEHGSVESDYRLGEGYRKMS